MPINRVGPCAWFPTSIRRWKTNGALTVKKDSFYESLNGLGIHEVIIESPDHEINMGTLDIDQCADILRAYRARMRVFGDDPRWRYLLLYKNQGERAGATLEHVHSQLIALPIVPQLADDELTRAKKHYDSTAHCIFCEIVQREVELRRASDVAIREIHCVLPFRAAF